MGAAGRGGGMGSFAADEAALKKGKGRMLAAMIGAVLAAFGALAWFALGNDESRVYRELGKQVNGMEQAHFRSFWGCALEGANLRNLKSNEDLVAQIDRRGMQGSRRYAVEVRDKCLETLTGMQPKLDTLIPPEDLQPSLRDLDKSISSLRSAWGGYIGYLDVDGLEYDADIARTHLMKVARGWYDFRRAHADFNNVVRSHLQ